MSERLECPSCGAPQEERLGERVETTQCAYCDGIIVLQDASDVAPTKSQRTPPVVRTTVSPPPIIGTIDGRSTGRRVSSFLPLLIFIGVVAVIWFTVQQIPMSRKHRSAVGTATQRKTDQRTNRHTDPWRSSASIQSAASQANEPNLERALHWVRAFRPVAAPAELEEYFLVQGFKLTDMDKRRAREPLEITDKRVFSSQVVRLDVDCSTDLAVFAQSCTIEGEVHGDLYFGGQHLEISRNATVYGSIHIIGAQVASISGTVKGDITGVRSDRVRTITGGKKIEGAIRSGSPIVDWLENKN